MRNKSSLARLLRGLVNLLAEESGNNPEFAKKLDQLLEPLAVKRTSTSAGSRKASPLPPLPDIYGERERLGEKEFEFWLRDQPISILHALIRKHDFDGARRTEKWKDKEKLAGFIAERLQNRLDRGSAFLRGNTNTDQ